MVPGAGRFRMLEKVWAEAKLGGKIPVNRNVKAVKAENILTRGLFLWR